jgi:general secretion pathway protein H
MKNRGFSLMELMIVLVIIGLGLMLVAPSLSRLSKTMELQGAAKKVSAILRYSRSEAVNQGRSYQVLFDMESRKVKVAIVDVAPKQGETDKKEEKSTDIKEKIYDLPAGVHIKEIKLTGSPSPPSDFPAIQFYPNGGSNGGSILIDSQDRKGYRIQVHFLTGMVEIEKV